MLPIAVDAMGGDKAPAEIVQGAVQAAEQLGVDVLLVGRAEAVMGADYLRDLTKQLGVPLVSTNVADSAGQPVAEVIALVELTV